MVGLSGARQSRKRWWLLSSAGRVILCAPGPGVGCGFKNRHSVDLPCGGENSDIRPKRQRWKRWLHPTFRCQSFTLPRTGNGRATNRGGLNEDAPRQSPGRSHHGEAYKWLSAERRSANMTCPLCLRDVERIFTRTCYSDGAGVPSSAGSDRGVPGRWDGLFLFAGRPAAGHDAGCDDPLQCRSLTDELLGQGDFREACARSRRERR